MIGGRVIDRIVQAVRRLRLATMAHTPIDRTCRIGADVHLRRLFNRGGRGRITLGCSCDLRDGVIVETWGGDIHLSDTVFVGPYVVMYGHGGITIGENTLLSMHCRVLSSNHSVPSAMESIRSQPDILMPTRIGRDVWLGAGVTVLGGVTIGDGCVVGAGAVVTHDLPPYSIAMGVPARVVRQRT